MTPQEFADRLGITRLRVYKWLERGHIAAYQIGPDKHPLYLIPKSELAVGRSRL